MDNYFDLLDKYFNSGMNSGERKAFEKQIREDPQLQSEYDAYKAAMALTDILAYEELRSRKGGSNPPPKITYHFRRYISYAASFLLLIVALLMWYANKSYSDEALANRYYSYPNFTTARGASNADNILMTASHLLDNDRYYDAIDMIREADSSVIQLPAVKMLLAHAFARSSQYDKAKALFIEIAEGSPGNWTDHARWNYGLILLKEGKTEEAQKVFQNISRDKTSDYSVKALKLLQGLHHPLRIFTF